MTLEEQARSRGVEPAYVDVDGRVHHASPDTLRAVLRALGPPHDRFGVAEGCCATTIDAKTWERRRGWGVFAPLYALQHGPGEPPSFTDLDRLGEWADGHGADTVATLPLLAAFLDGPVDVSPYAPASRQMWNEAYIDLARVPELAGTDVDVGVTDTRTVDMAAVLAAKRSHLERAAQRLSRERRVTLALFLDEHRAVGEYARFRAARERHGTDWRVWPAAWRPRSIPDDAVDEAVCRYHEYVQWVADEQLGSVADALRTRGQSLYLDLPAGTHPLGFDVWSEPEDFVEGVTVGAPPDTFNAGGQNWGFPPLHPEASRAGGHAHFRACLRHHLRHADRLRIDHVMGLHRLYWIPEGAPATDGAYVRYRHDELYDALLFEAERHGARIVGENLGTVPDEVQRELARRQIATMHVVQFESGPPPPMSVASLSTHDTPTFAAFWCDPHASAALNRLLEELGSSDAELVMVALEDLWLETEPQNVPGTTTEYPNWTQRAAHRLDELPALVEVGERLDRLDASRRTPAGRTTASC